MQALTDIKPLINGTPAKIAITMHQNPDADAMGSALALQDYLSRKGHQITVISPNEFPAFLRWMPGCDAVLVYESHKEQAETVLKQASLLFCVDFNAFHRTRHLAPLLEQTQATKILIDHHLHPDPGFDYGKSDTTAAATALLIYEFIVAMGDFSMINLDMAQCIYAGTMTDTGSFRFPATSSRVHRMIAELMDLGLDHEAVHTAIYDNYQENRLRFIGQVLVDRLKIYYPYNTAVIAVPRSMVHKFDLQAGDTEGLVNLPLSIKGIKFAALLTDRNDEVRISFRSKGDFDVNAFAQKYFNGGGHKNAAGGRSTDSLKMTITRLEEALKENKDLLN